MHLSRTRQDVTIDRQTLHMMYHIEYQEGLLALTFLNKVQVKECMNVKKKICSTNDRYTTHATEIMTSMKEKVDF